MIKEIVEGWYNQARTELGILPKHVQILSDKRLKICSECEFRKENKCSVCGCPILKKTKSVSSVCPKNLW